MATTVQVDQHFSAEQIGKALARLHDIDGLTLCLRTRLDQNGQEPTCPISLSSILQNAAIIQDGSNEVYQLGWIQRWLTDHDRSPMTNCVLPHRNILRVSSLTGVLQSFLCECFKHRGQSWKQRITKAKCTSRDSCEGMEKALLEIESYLTHARHEMAKWLEYICDLEDEAIALREDWLRCRRRHAQALSRVCLNSAFGTISRRQQLQDSASSQIKSIYRKFQAQWHLQQMTTTQAAAACIQGCARRFLAQSAIARSIAARRQELLSAQLLKAVDNDLDPIVIETLLQRRASPDVAGEDGFTPCHIACCEGRGQFCSF